MTHSSLAFLLGLGSDKVDDGADAVSVVREEEVSPVGRNDLQHGWAPFKQLRRRGAAEPTALLL